MTDEDEGKKATPTSGIKELLIGAVDGLLCDILQAPMSGAELLWRACESEKEKTAELDTFLRLTKVALTSKQVKNVILLHSGQGFLKAKTWMWLKKGGGSLFDSIAG